MKKKNKITLLRSYSGFTRYWGRVFWAYARANSVIVAKHRFGFVIEMIFMLVLPLRPLVLFAVAFSFTDRINGWGLNEFLVLTVTWQVVNLFFKEFFMIGVAELPDRVRRGTIEFVLTCPLPPLLGLAFSGMSAIRLLQIPLTFAVLVILLKLMDIPLTFWQVSTYLGLVVCNALLLCILYALLIVPCLWEPLAQHWKQLWYATEEWGAYPRSIWNEQYGDWIGLVVPVILAANVPVEVLLGVASIKTFVWLGVLVVLMGVLAVFLWSIGLKRLMCLNC